MKKNPTDLDEQVFENRNKAYGAYRLRKAYVGIIIGAAIFVALWLLFVFGGVPFLGGDFNQGKPAKDPKKIPELPTGIKSTLPINNSAIDTNQAQPQETTLVVPNRTNLEKREKSRFYTPNEREVPVVIPKRGEAAKSKPSSNSPSASIVDQDNEGKPLRSPESYTIYWDSLYADGEDLPTINPCGQNNRFWEDPHIEKEPVPTNLEEINKKIGYPKELVDAEIEGRVLVRVLVGKGGQVEKYLMLNKKPYDRNRNTDSRLIELVEPWVPKLTFEPALARGKPFCVWVTVPFNFRLNR